MADPADSLFVSTMPGQFFFGLPMRPCPQAIGYAMLLSEVLFMQVRSIVPYNQLL